MSSAYGDAAPNRTNDIPDATTSSTAAAAKAASAAADAEAANAASGSASTGEIPAEDPNPEEPRAVPAGSTRDGGPTAAQAATTAAEHGKGTFRSFQIRNYRLFFAGNIVSNTGTWMQRIAQDWLVLSITGSPTAVGITTALQFLPMLFFGLYGGVIADRCNKRALLIATQSGMGLAGAFLAVVTLTGHVQVWHVYIAALWIGLLTVLDNPARQTFVPEMVGRDTLRNAVSLNAANFQTARLVGPAVSGVVMGAAGAGWAFAINAVSFIGPLVALLMIRESELHKAPRVERSKGQLREGMRYVGSHPELLWPIVLIGFIGTFGFNFPVILSAFASDVFHTGAESFALFNTAMAVGSLAGALLAARRTSSRMRMVVAAAFGFGLVQALTALMPGYWPFLLMLVPLGALGLTVNTMSNTTVQLATDPEMRGRVMGLYMLVFMGGTPIGSPVVGWVTEHYGARVGMLACGLIAATAALVIGLVLARVGGLRLRVGLRRENRGSRGRIITVVPRQAASDPAVSGAAVPELGRLPEGERVQAAAAA